MELPVICTTLLIGEELLETKVLKKSITVSISVLAVQVRTLLPHRYTQVLSLKKTPETMSLPEVTHLNWQ